MRTHRIHTPQRLEPGRKVRLDERAGHYLGRVLRVAAGHRVLLFNGDGRDYLAQVERPGRNGVVLTVIEARSAAAESPLAITVVQSVSRGERMDQTLQKCTELGAAAFRPLLSERVEVRLRGERMEKRVGHWRAVVVSACEQSGRARVPPVHRPLALTDWLERGDGGLRVALVPGADSALAGLEAEVRNGIALLVGPEGGFSDAELERMRENGVHAAGLGPRTLRTETAAPAAVAILQARFGDLG